jgi:capsular exopolysaccharide synthesis family protein
MEIKGYLTILWRRRGIITITVVVAAVVAIIGASRIVPVYQASTVLRVSPSHGNRIDLGDVTYTDRLMQTYAQIVTSRPMLEDLRNQTGITASIDDLRGSVSVNFPPNTELMEIEVEHRDPVLTAEVANGLANLLIAESRSTSVGRDYVLSLVDPAGIPDNPTQMSSTTLVLLGAFAGLIGGLGLALLIENLDTSLHTREQIEEATQWSTLVNIPLARERKSLFLNGQSVAGEAFRQLRATIFTLYSPTPLKTLLVVSAEPGEGKSKVVTNLAYSIAQNGQRVVVVDADMRRPTQHKNFKIANTVGLSSLLTDDTTLDIEDVLQEGIPGISVITSGPKPADPAALLGSTHMKRVMGQLSDQFDVVLVDSPALLAMVDASVVASLVEGIVMVVRATRTRQESVQNARRKLVGVEDKILGVVVNQAEPESAYAYYR